MNIPFLRQLLVVSSTLLAAISTGAIIGLPSILVQDLKKNSSLIQLDLDTETWIASVHGFAGIPSIVIPYLMQCWGRKFGFRCSCLSVLIGWIILCFAKSSLTVIIAEVFQGAGVKILLIVCMVTISEMVDPKIRSISIASYGIVQTFSILVVHTSGNFVHWKTISVIMCIPIGLAIMFSFIWPESPAWLAYKGRFEESKKSFIWLRGKNKESLVEMNALFMAQREFWRSQMSGKSSKSTKQLVKALWLKISGRDFYLPIFHMFVLMTCYYWSGNLLIIVYGIRIVGQVIQNNEAAFIGMIVIDIASVIGNVICPILLKYFANKTILLTGGVLSIFFLICSSTVLYLQEIGVVATDSLLCLYSIVGFMICTATSLFMVPFCIATEIIPLRHRGVAGSLYVIFMSVFYTSSLKVAPYIIIYLGIYGLFLLYAFILICCFTWIWKFVPETKNKTLQSIEGHFFNNSKDLRVNEDEETNESLKLNGVI